MQPTPKDIEVATDAVRRYCQREISSKSPALAVVMSIFPEHRLPDGFFELPDAEFEFESARIEREQKARSLKASAMLAMIAGEDTNSLRLPRPDAGLYTEAASTRLAWAAIFGADQVFRQAASYSMLANMHLANNGYFDHTTPETAQ